MVNQGVEVFYISTVGKHELILYLEGANDVLRYDTEILEIFCKNISIAIENIRLNDELKRTQEEIVYHWKK